MSIVTFSFSVLAIFMCKELRKKRELDKRRKKLEELANPLFVDFEDGWFGDEETLEWNHGEIRSTYRTSLRRCTLSPIPYKIKGVNLLLDFKCADMGVFRMISYANIWSDGYGNKMKTEGSYIVGKTGY